MQATGLGQGKGNKGQKEIKLEFNRNAPGNPAAILQTDMAPEIHPVHRKGYAGICPLEDLQEQDSANDPAQEVEGIEGEDAKEAALPVEA